MTTLATLAAGVDTGDTAWLLVSSALVLLMAPGLALFYGGMVRSKSVLNMMMMTFGALAVILIVWTVVGYSLAFGDDLGAGLLGNPLQYAGLGQLLSPAADGVGTVPAILFAVFQGLFCVITGALVSGAIADRARFGAWLVFIGAWTILVYAPVAHWVFDFSSGTHVGGWLANQIGVVDFAGGTAVEICSGASGLALALVLGKRIGFDEAIANVLEFEGDTLTGTVASPIVDKTTKLNRLTALAVERTLPLTATLAVGDGANDLDMIKAAGLGVALHAKPHVAAEAQVRIDPTRGRTTVRTVSLVS